MTTDRWSLVDYDVVGWMGDHSVTAWYEYGNTVIMLRLSHYAGAGVFPSPAVTVAVTGSRLAEYIA